MYVAGGLYEQDPSTGQYKKYYRLGGRLVAEREVPTGGTSSTTGTLHYLHQDHLGSTTLQSTSGGAYEGHQFRGPFGQPWATGGTLATDLQYTGQRSFEGGAAPMGSLLDYGSRSYSPILGRFLSPDTIVPGAGNPQNLNRYAYVGNNPLRYTDPTGHAAACEEINDCGNDWDSVKYPSGYSTSDRSDNPCRDYNDCSNDWPGCSSGYDCASRGLANWLNDTSRELAETIDIASAAAAGSNCGWSGGGCGGTWLGGGGGRGGGGGFSGGPPQGLTDEQFDPARRLIRQRTDWIGGEPYVHGSRAAGTASAGSDIDFAIRVSGERFGELIEIAFGTPNPGSAWERTMLWAIDTGKIQAGELGLSGLRRELKAMLNMEVDLSAIRIGGPFDNGPFIALAAGGVGGI